MGLVVPRSNCKTTSSGCNRDHDYRQDDYRDQAALLGQWQFAKLRKVDLADMHFYSLLHGPPLFLDEVYLFSSLFNRTVRSVSVSFILFTVRNNERKISVIL